MGGGGRVGHGHSRAACSLPFFLAFTVKTDTLRESQGGSGGGGGGGGSGMGASGAAAAAALRQSREAMAEVWSGMLAAKEGGGGGGGGILAAAAAGVDGSGGKADQRASRS